MNPCGGVILSDKIFSSPLWYPGGKKWLVKTLFERMPPDTADRTGEHLLSKAKQMVTVLSADEGTDKTLARPQIVSPFLGGGVFELNAAYRGLVVHGYDVDVPLVNFYKAFLKSPRNMIEAAHRLLHQHPDTQFWIERKKAYRDDTEDYESIPPEMFYVLNRLTPMGLGFKDTRVRDFTYRDGEFFKRTYATETPSDFSRRVFTHVQFWKCFPQIPLSVEKLDFEESLARHPDIFAYLDPPYVKQGKSCYRYGTMDHARLATVLKNRRNWVLSYDDCELVRELYAGFSVLTHERLYRINNRGGCHRKTEVLILSPDIAERHKHLR